MQQIKYYMLGEQALVMELSPPVTLASQQKIWGLVRRLGSQPQVRQAIPGMNNLTVILWDIPADAEQALDQLRHDWEGSSADIPESRTIDVPVIYGGDGGPDLQEVARHSQLSPSQVVELHSSGQYTVYFIGFQPGFPYMAGLNPKIHCPRRAEPRVAVPAGSVGIGGSQTGIYPLPTPGGWQLIGLASVPLFSPERDPAVLLAPGDTVRFVPQKGGQC